MKMNNESKKLLFLATIATSVMVGCGSGKSVGDNMSAVSATVGDKGNVPFTEMRQYFVRNDVRGLPPIRIDSDSALNANFGMAMVMGEGGRPTTVDFTKEFCISVTLPETDTATEIRPVSLSRSSEGKLIFTYSVSRGNKQTYTILPQLLVKVSRRYDGDVRLCQQ